VTVCRQRAASWVGIHGRRQSSLGASFPQFGPATISRGAHFHKPVKGDAENSRELNIPVILP